MKVDQELETRFLAAFNPNAAIVHRICNAWLTDPEGRRDLFQEIVYQIWKSYPTFSGDAKFTTWMYKVALNTAVTFVQKKKQRPDQIPLTNQEPADTSDHADEEKITILYRAIHELSAIDKAIILLYLEDHSYEEIAAVTGLTRTNVSVKLVRIKKSLETKINKIK